MDKIYNDIEDFLTDESFRSWVKSPTPELDNHWKAWMEANHAKVQMLNKSKEIIQALHFKDFPSDVESKQRILSKIKLELSRRKLFSLPSTWYKVAAILVLGFGIGALIRFNSFDKNLATLFNTSELVRKSNPAGVKSRHILSDGSIVYLNSLSSIEYPTTFDDNTRVVQLKGEGFFQVSKDVKRPFRVLVDDFEVEVFGTTFNVNSNLEFPSVALVEGKVTVNSRRNGTSLKLTPGQMAIFDRRKTSFKSSQFDVDYITGWKDGNLIFREATLDEVIEKLHVWYGIEISVSNRSKSGDWSYTGNFRNESLENVLSSMSTLRNFDYVIKRDSLIISF